MKIVLCVVAFILTMAFAGGCSKKQSIQSADVSVTALATGAKTKSGQPVDAYELQISKVPTVILVVGGGKLETSSQYLLTLDGQMLAVNRQAMNNQVLILEKKRLAFTPIPNLTPADVKAKCAAKGVIDLPIDETLAAIPAPPPTSTPRY